MSEPVHKKILITVKTYPTFSKTYEELVCTAGIDEDGNWIRLYPVPFRKLDYSKQYKKYYWVSADVVRKDSDFRHESYSPLDIDNIDIGSKVDTKKKWSERRNLVLNNVYTDMNKLIEDARDKDKGYISLATFKPAKIVGFSCIKKKENEIDKIDKKEKNENLNLFEEKKKPVKPLLYSFKYKFADEKGRVSEMTIIDWEIGALFWKYKNEEIACKKVKEKYMKFANETDIHLFLGTMKSKHMTAKNPFTIIGVFPIPFNYARTFELDD